MHRIDKLLIKLDAITRLNDGEIPLILHRLSITSTLNNIIAMMLKDWPCEIDKQDEDRLLPILVDYFEMGDELCLSRKHLEWAIKEGYEPLIPLLAVRHLLRDKRLLIDVEHTTKREWVEFTSRYQSMIERLDEALLLRVH